MAMLGRKAPAAPPTSGRKEPPRAAAVSSDNSRIGKLRTNIRDIMAELRKVTWPTREETRNLTIVVIGISVFLGALLGSVDFVLSFLYNFVRH